MNRTGIGYDIHRLVPGRPLILGGIPIPYERGLSGHSDADVLLHAISDAILGAAAKADIGTYFPPDDDRFRDMDSSEILKEALAIAGREGFRIVNIDTIIIAEQPKLAGYFRDIVRSLARLTGLPESAVNVKAKTNEGLDAAGRGEAIAAYAVVGMEK